MYTLNNMTDTTPLSLRSWFTTRKSYTPVFQSLTDLGLMCSNINAESKARSVVGCRHYTYGHIM